MMCVNRSICDGDVGVGSFPPFVCLALSLEEGFFPGGWNSSKRVVYPIAE